MTQINFVVLAIDMPKIIKVSKNFDCIFFLRHSVNVLNCIRQCHTQGHKFTFTVSAPV